MNEQELEDYVEAARAQEYKDALKALEGAAWQASASAHVADEGSNGINFACIACMVSSMRKGEKPAFKIVTADKVAS